MSNNQCPECGYPDTKDGQHFKGIYNPQLPCDHCKYEPGKRKLDDIVEEMLTEHLKTRKGILHLVPYALSWLRGAQLADTSESIVMGRVARVMDALAADVLAMEPRKTENTSQVPGPYPTAWANYAMKDLELHVRVRMQHDCVMDYEVREFTPYDDGVGDSHKFEMTAENGAVEYTADIEKSAKLIEGTIKWDGCSHNNFAPDESNRGYIHGCSRQDLMRLGELYRRLFDIAMERMPNNTDYLS